MTDREILAAHDQSIVTVLKMANRQLARVRALGDMLESLVPPEERRQWNVEYDKLTAKYHFETLVKLERVSPSSAAALNDLTGREMRDVTESGDGDGASD